ncbi:MAG TPA: DUF4347 domain-containing protein [Gammaproteobacteria bacterium]
MTVMKRIPGARVLAAALLAGFILPAAAATGGDETALIVLDPAVRMSGVLLEGVDENNVLRLDAQGNPLEQIRAALRERPDVRSLHVVSHGVAGNISLGELELNAASLADNSEALHEIGVLLGKDADLLFYACDIAGTPDGRAFVDALAQVSGIDVAASENTTGHAQLGGDWNLEYATGAIESPLPFLAGAIDGYRDMLSHFRGGSITWQSKALDGDGLRNDVEITVKVAWRYDWSPLPENISIASDQPGFTAVEKSDSLIYVNGDDSGADYALQTTIFEAKDLDPATQYLVYFIGTARIKATDGLKNNAEGDWKIQTRIFLEDDNLAPKIDLPIIFEVPQLQPDGTTTLANWTFDLGSTDPNADKLRYRLANQSELGCDSAALDCGYTNPTDLSINPNTGLLTWTGSGSKATGLYSAGIVAEDVDENGNAKSKTHVDLLLSLVNKAQTDFTIDASIPETRNVIVEKGDSFTFNISGTAIDTQSLGDIQGALTKDASESDANVDTYTFEPGAVGATSGPDLDPGSYPITFEVRDSTDSDSKNYLVLTFIVPDPNAPRIANLEADRVTYPGGDGVPVDADSDALVSDANTSDFQGGFLKLNVTFTDGQYEVLGIESQGTGSGQIQRTGNEIFYEGSRIGEVSATLDGVGTALRVDFTDPTGLAALQALVRSLTYEDTFTLRAEGDRALSLYLRDPEGLSVAHDFYVYVEPDASAPNTGGPVQAANRITLVEGDAIALSNENISFADPDGDAIKFTVTAVDHGHFAYVSDSATAITNFTQQEINLGQIAFVHDGGEDAPTYSLSASDDTNPAVPAPGTVNFSNVSDQAPAITSPSAATVPEGSAYAWTPTVTDADEGEDDPEFSITNKPAWASFDTATGKLSGTPADGDAGTYTGIVITVTDPGGLSDSTDAFTITVEAVNEAPTLTATAENPTFIEGNSAVALFSDAAASTVETGQSLTGFKLTVSNATNGSLETLAVDGSTIALADGTTGSTPGSGLDYSVSVSGTAATISFSGGALSPAGMQSLVNGMAYANASMSLSPAGATRNVVLASLTDSGGTANGGDDTATLSLTSTVTVVDNTAPAVSDANIAISGASGDDGSFVVGDTLTATWNNTATGDGNTDTITVSVDFSEFGGGAVAATNSSGTWTATYTIASDSTQGSDLNVTVTATDNAGHATTTADSSGATVDIAVPSGHDADFDDDLINAAEAGSQAFTFSGAEVGASYGYRISSSGGGTNVTGSGTIASATQQVVGIDLSGLNDGTLSLSVTLTDSAGNAASAVTDTATLDTTAPNGHSIGFDDDLINAAEADSQGFTFSGAEVGADYSWTISSDGGGTDVTGSGTIASATQQLTGIDVSGLNDGTLTLSVTLTDEAGNAASAVTGTATLDTAAPGGHAVSFDDTLINGAEADSRSFTFSDAEVGADYSYTISSDGGGTDVTGSGTIASATQQVTGIDVSGLDDGTLNLSVVLTDEAGNAAGAVTDTATLDTAGPVPVIASSATGPVNDAFVATIDFDETVTGFVAGDITAGNATLGGFTDNGDGSYSVTATPGSDGAVTLDVPAGVATDAAGNGNGAAVRFSIEHDGTPPAAPPAPDMAAADDHGPSDTDNVTYSTAPDLSGSAEADATVTVSSDTQGVIGTTTADGAGAWSLAGYANLAEGKHKLTAKATDSAGNTSAAGTALTVTIDTTSPTLTGTQPEDDAADATYNAGEIALDYSEAMNAGTVTSVEIRTSEGDLFEAVPVTSVSFAADGTVTIPLGSDLAPGETYHVAAAAGEFEDIAGLKPGVFAFQFTAHNAAPAASADSGSTSEDDSVTVDVLANDSDAEGALDAASVTVTGAPAHGTTSVNETSGVVTYTPAANYNGADSFTYEVADEHGVTGTAAVNITVTAVNDAPTIAGTPATTAVAGVSYTFTPVIADVEEDAVSVTGTGVPGWASLDAETGVLSGTPAAGDVAAYKNIVITVSDGALSTSLAAFSIEVLADADGDGTADADDSDDDGDGISDADEGTGDTDEDGVPDSLDTDSDNDGIDDNVETAVDTDGDGTANHLDADSDNDDIGDATEGAVDSDGDGVRDYVDIDSDGDRLPDILEGASDTDGDAASDYLDTDSDNDTIPDRIEVPGMHADADSNGIPDVFDAATGGADANGDGIDDAASIAGLETDPDGDGLPGYRDTDSDNDSVPDRLESGATGTDDDADGIDAAWDPDDAILNNLSDARLPDSDSDGSADVRDADSDGDSIPDALESGAQGTDGDGDGVDAAFDEDDTDSALDGISTGAELRDTDGTGEPDLRDTDSDDDGIGDAVEAQLSGDDADSDGIDDDLEGGTDANGDGVADGVNVHDEDGDLAADYIDTDSDADTIDDAVEGVDDDDADGIPNYLDIDSDSDGVSDEVENAEGSDSTDPSSQPADSDNDGLPDVVDANDGNIDADGDGIADGADVDAAGGTDTDGDGIRDGVDADVGNDGTNENGADTDGDGVVDTADSVDDATDTDGDGLPDDVDPDDAGTDADGDGIPDGADADVDGDGTSDNGTDGDADGINDLTEGDDDSDGDGTSNRLDTDSDGDGIPDAGEGAVDNDGDGTADYIDTDSDNDGIDDADEGAVDTDSDGTADYVDTDSDNDGMDDADEGAVDTDSDGTADYVDTDSDNDGIADAGEGPADPDGDGTPNYLDADTDGDGISDSIEGAGDSDSDGTADYLDTDSDGDGISDASEGSGDADGDGTPDNIDEDSDNDGVDDADEGAGDTDGDGVPDSVDTDSDNDGMDDADEGAADTDADGVRDAADIDSDGDRVPDILEGATDTDGDGASDYLDTDADGDRVPDRVEVPEMTGDADGDGVPDVFDADSTGGSDANGDGIDDEAALGDTDTDGVADYRDADADNDGIPDTLESGADGVDSNGDGIDDAWDANAGGATDMDGDGINDDASLRDTDADGMPDLRDADSDGDGIDDADEAQLSGSDSDGDGIDDDLDVDTAGGGDGNSDGITDGAGPHDGDLDGTPDHIDTDSDDDGIGDSTEGVIDSDADGAGDYLDFDSDGDGINDADEGTGDTDGDGNADYVDTDSDNDGIDDADEGAADSDGDGAADYVDTDSDDDGIDDAAEGAADSDSDGAADYVDTDSDDDGIDDADEGAVDSDGDGAADYIDPDSDNDGIDDAGEGDVDSDGDGTADYVDTDSDDDGIDDADEGTAGADTDGDGKPDHLDADSDGDGIDDVEEGTGDSDGDGASDNLDTDSDNDGADDAAEGTGDSDGDGTADYLDTSIDEDGDGIPDIVEGATDSDGDGDADFADTDSDDDGVPDALEIAGLDEDADDDGIGDRFDADATGDADGNGDGIDDALLPDADRDGRTAQRDPDQDGDGIPDAIESGSHGFDSDNDGIDDRWDADTSGSTDADGDGMDDAAAVIDSDADGVADLRDADSDRDGVSDAAESGASETDIDGDGIDDAFDVDTADGTDANGDGIADGAAAADTDGDGTPDYLDLDSDNDGITDVIEAGGRDADEDGLLDNGGTATSTPRDTDGDGVPDLRDADSDGDGVNDIEGGIYGPLDGDGDGRIDDHGDDTDGDGIADAIDSEPDQRGSRTDSDDDGVPVNRDQDDDGDGVPDSLEGEDDTDGDGAVDRLDRDGDNDGISDSIEAGMPPGSGDDTDLDGVDDEIDADATGGADADGDGIDDRFGDRDSDGDGISDRQDGDSDNDGLADAYESLTVELTGADSDGDGIDDAMDADATGGADADGDGVDDAVINLADTDGDGLENYRDPDSDNDGVMDGEEDGDFNGDGTNDRFQEDPGVDTGLEGGGAFGWLIFAVLLAFGAVRRTAGNRNAILALFGLIVAMFAPSAGAASVHAEEIRIEPGTASVVVPVTLAGFENVSDVVAVVSVPQNGGALAIDTTGLALELEYGYETFEGKAIGFHGSLADVAAALRERLSWHAPAEATTTTLSVSVSEYRPDYFYNPDNGHYYKAVSTGGAVEWTAARDVAATESLNGMQGYLATVGSEAENIFVAHFVDVENVWLAASDSQAVIAAACGDSIASTQDEAEGRWRWVAGPEACLPFWQSEGEGRAVDGSYASWEEGEPNNFRGGEHFAATNYNGVLGKWNDFAGGTPFVQSFLVEFGGMPDDAASLRTARGAITLAVAEPAPVAVAPVEPEPVPMVKEEPVDDVCRTGMLFLDGCWAVGAGVVSSSLEPDDSRSGWKLVDDGDTGFKLSLEYRFFERWFLELGYADLGSAALENLNPAIAGRKALDYKVPSLLAGYLLFDPASRFNVHLKAGYATLSNDFDARTSSEQLHGSQLALGAGARWRLLPQAFPDLRLDLEFEAYDKDAAFIGLMVKSGF